MSGTKSFGEWLRHRRRELDLTQEELARQVGCARISIRKIEADQMRPSKQLAELLIKHLRVPAQEAGNFMRLARGGASASSVETFESPDNLPHPISSFIGREREIAEVKRLIGNSRLVTLTGAGGCGKTRLAIEVAGQILDGFPGGAWFVGFAPLSNSTLVHQTIASALRVREDPSRPLIETLCAYLHSKHLLLLFDNCEHLIEECAQVADTLLQACPQLQILVTSREALRIEGEEQYYVPCLSLPEGGVDEPIERLKRSEAVRLFVERAARVQPTFGLTFENSSPVVQICQRLDGMPLAIELAAARVKLLNVGHIAERLDDRFNLLTSGSRSALPRHQTLRATMDWSYDLLAGNTRVLYRRLSVFSGGFTQDAAQAVCSDDVFEGVEVLGELSRLVDRSIVEVIQAGDGERYRMLETIRQYARERLKESGEERQVRDRHLRYYMDWTEAVEPRLRGPGQIAWWDRIETEHDNIRAALDWSLDGGDKQLGLRLAGAAFWFWKPRSYWKEGLKWLKETLAVDPQGRSSQARAKALVVAGNMAMEMYTADPVDDWYEQSLKIWRDMGNKWWASYTLLLMGWHRILVNEAASARFLFEESVAFARQAQDAWIMGYALRGLGSVIERFDYAAARPILEESLLHSQTAGDRWVLADALKQLGTLALGQAEYAEAAALGEQSLRLFREMGDKEFKTETLGLLALAALGQGDFKRAEGFCRESMLLAKSIGYNSQIGVDLLNSAFIAEAEGQPRRSAILLAAGEALLNSMGTTRSMWPWIRADYDQCIPSVQAQLGDNEFGTATAEGRVMTPEQAINYALEGFKED
jgi:non-specific serine/threonine protein kinase